MKKILSVNLIIILTLLLCSCGQNKITENITSEFEKTTVLEETTTEVFSLTEDVQTTSEKSNISSNTTTSNTNKATSKTTGTTTKSSTVTQKSQSTSTTKKETKNITCTVEISCKTIKANKTNLKPEKKEFVPKKYVILSKKQIIIPEGSSAFDAIKKVCQENKCDENCVFCSKTGSIHLDFVYTPGFESDYIRGIHQIYEKDCGTRSGWMYSVNDVFPNYGCNKYIIKNNDTIKVLYTCDLGEDIK